jgi:ribosomal protein S18 acetylase RimI-like enzyme
MSNQTIVRKAVPADLDAIVALWREFMDFHAQRDTHLARSADGHERFKEFVGERLASDDSCVLVAEQDGEVVGYCLTMLAKAPPVLEDRDYGTVCDLAVTERCRGGGVGARLYRAAEAWLAQRGIRRIEVRVLVANEVSTAFWRKMGFEPYVATVCKRL